MKKITAYQVHATGEGERATFTYSLIDDEGNVTAQNKRAEIILVDEDALSAAETLYNFLESKIPE